MYLFFFLKLAYPFSLCLCSLFDFSFLQWSPNTWCEQTWRFLGIVQMVVMLLS